MTTYQVTGECAYFTQGGQKQLLLRNAIVGPGATDAEIKHNLSAGLISSIGGSVKVEHAAAGSADGAGSRTAEATGAVVDGEVEARRADARKKLTAAGGVPKGTHGEDVWVEAAVAKGYSYADAVKAGKSELQRLLDAK